MLSIFFDLEKAYYTSWKYRIMKDFHDINFRGRSAFTLSLFLLSHGIIMHCHCSSTMTKDHFLLTFYGTKCPICVDVPLNIIYSFISFTPFYSKSERKYRVKIGTSLSDFYLSSPG